MRRRSPLIELVGSLTSMPVKVGIERSALTPMLTLSSIRESENRRGYCP